MGTSLSFPFYLPQSQFVASFDLLKFNYCPFIPYPVSLCSSCSAADGSFQVLTDFPGRHGAALRLLASESHSRAPEQVPECFSSLSHVEVASANSQELLLLWPSRTSFLGLHSLTLSTKETKFFHRKIPDLNPTSASPTPCSARTQAACGSSILGVSLCPPGDFPSLGMHVSRLTGPRAEKP